MGMGMDGEARGHFHELGFGVHRVPLHLGGFEIDQGDGILHREPGVGCGTSYHVFAWRSMKVLSTPFGQSLASQMIN